MITTTHTHITTTKRDLTALLIPSGVSIIIKAGTNFQITQFKGGTATVYADGNLIRVSRKDLDALGIEVDPINDNYNSSLSNNNYYKVSDSKQKKITGPVNIELVWQALKTCYDPEVPVNIVELGLIYSCNLLDNKVIIDLTLTAPMCGMGPILIEDIKERVLEVPNVLEVQTNMVFDPPWTIERLSEAAKLELGFI